MHRPPPTVKSPAYLVKSVDALLAFNVGFVVSKDLESGQETRRLTGTSATYGATWWRSTVNAGFVLLLSDMRTPQGGHVRCVFTCHDASAC